ncbi:hypothetical protein BCR41DRAFT_406194 [Lobosporangium transversale]|uniref:RNI-like protein n=1 Tax=Lobosporangium transversale TaxID=64571 RepID=A0A1Y2GMJ4_9FUNG|nr:hypothetical protein BCR41DRAFT_406194 [Lobosporangium transversale]ORZ15526.1 hypothetical protein BCR41DRAFT_406194 [Lobosporangium transversale]|eukprot:XP_021881274.1 hypothetical protein BCR41DRAFT_406194 [Lobosporangium transversale]
MKKSVHLASQDLLQSLSALVQSFRSSLTAHRNTQTEMAKSELEQIKELQLHVKERNDGLLEVQSEIHKLQLKAKENDKVLKLQLEVLQLRQESKEKDEKSTCLLCQTLDKPAIIQKHTNQTPNRVAILQKHAKSILAQNFEIYDTKWDPTNVLRNKIRLHFLCESGEYTVEANKSIQTPIHITNHEEYEIRNSTEFFRKYGKHMVILLEWLKLKMLSPTSLIPPPHLTDAAIDKSLEYMQVLSIEYPVLSSINIVDDYEALEGTDLQQLSTFLQIDGKDKQLGDMYRTTTATGHAKWVCFDHYRLTYKEKEQKELENVIEANGDEYDKHLGKVVIELGSGSPVKKLCNALADARCDYELNITSIWSWSEADLVALENTLKVPNVSILRLELAWFQERSRGNAVSTSAPYEILVRIMELSNMRMIRIALMSNLIELSRLQPKSLSHLHELSLVLRPRGLETNDFRTLADSLKTNTTVTTLDLWDNSIGNEGAFALSKALKINKALTTLDLALNSIEKEGVLAMSGALKINEALTTLSLRGNPVEDGGALVLSEALRINTTLTTLDLENASIKKEGALALPTALKVNTTLISLNLNSNPIGKGGVLALSEALKVNTVFSTLSLGFNSIGNEGAVALSEALKANMALTTLNLRCNEVETEGALALSEALKVNKTLTYLNLSLNSIGNEGALALSEALKVNSTLTVLNSRASVVAKGF